MALGSTTPPVSSQAVSVQSPGRRAGKPSDRFSARNTPFQRVRSIGLGVAGFPGSREIFKTWSYFFSRASGPSFTNNSIAWIVTVLPWKRNGRCSLVSAMVNVW